MSFEVLRASVSMADELGAVHAASWQKAYKGIVPDNFLKLFTPEKRAQVFRENLPNAKEEYYLFRVNDRPAGLAILHKSHEEGAGDYDGEIYALYFHPDFWGGEYTHMAMEFCLSRLKSLGYRNLTVWALPENKRACRFYEKYGFAPDGATNEINVGKVLTQIRFSKACG